MVTIYGYLLAFDPEEEKGTHTVPAKIPAAPTPAIALPAIKDAELGAAPQRAEAASKTRMLVMRVIFTE